MLVEACKTAKQRHVDENFESVKEGFFKIKEHEGVPNIKEYRDLKARALRAPLGALAGVSAAKLAKYEARRALASAYSPGSQATIAALDASIQYTANCKLLALELKTATAASSLESKKLDEMCRSRLNRPIEKAWEKILAEYDIHYQQFYSMSLVGEHIHRLMVNSGKICQRSKILMLLSIDEDLPDCVAKRASVELFMGQMIELMDAFDWLCSVMNKTVIQSEQAND